MTVPTTAAILPVFLTAQGHHTATAIATYSLRQTLVQAMLLAAMFGLAVFVYRGMRHLLGRNTVSRKSQSGTAAPASPKPSLETLTGIYGEPAHIIVANATRGNEADGSLLVYDGDGPGQGFIVYDGIRVSRACITEATFNNAANPYTENNYQIVLTTTDNAHPRIYIPAGPDAAWAGEVLYEIKLRLNIQ